MKSYKTIIFFGIILSIRNDVEIPSLVEVLWDNGHISRVYQDELIVATESDFKL